MVSIQILPLKIFSVSTLSLLIFLNIRHHA
jgi:hypothetical protein